MIKAVENRYKLDLIRTINVCTLPAIFTVMFFILLKSKTDDFGDLTAIDITAWSLLLVFIVGVFVYLFINHFSLAKATELVVTQHSFTICQDGQCHSCDLSAITGIIEYSSAKLPWSHVCKWIVRTGEREFMITSLTISRSDFERHFWNKIEHKTSLFPII